MIQVQLLGPPQILRDGEVVAINRRKSRALVYYLAAQPVPVRREQLLAFFWPDHPRESAQQILRSSLSNLRKLLGDALLADGDTLSLSAQVDARRFENVLARPPEVEVDLQAALDAYRGPFLEGFSLPDEAAFENWQSASEEYYRRLMIRGLAQLARLRERDRNYPGAVLALDQALRLDPLQEDVQREVLRATYLAGDRPGAIRRYEALVRLLDEELGVPPMAETRALYDAILNDQVSPPPAGPPPETLRSVPHREPARADSGLPFTGRQVELARLDQAAQDHRLVLISGEAGVGKSRLAQEYLYSRGGIVVQAVTRELEQTLPYLPFVHLLNRIVRLPEWERLRPAITLDELWWSQLARLAPELAPHPARPDAPLSGLDETRLWEAVSRFLLALAGKIPLAIFLDDLHWADSASLGLLGYLAGQNAAADAPLSLIGAAQPAGPQTALGKMAAGLERQGILEPIHLERFSTEEIRSISTRLSPNFHEPLSFWLEKNSEGSPFVLAELIRHAHETGLLDAGGVLNLNILSNSPVVPTPVFSLVSARLARLSPSARQVLDIAVAIGRDFEYQILSQASPLPEDATIDALDELLDAGLIHPRNGDGLAYSFDHSLVMEVAWREAGEARHRRFHRRVAEALVELRHNDLESAAGLIASHFSEGLAADKAAFYARIAARQAANLSAWDEAGRFYRMALAGTTAPAERIELLLGLGAVLAQKGDNAPAIEAYQEAAKTARQTGSLIPYDMARLGLARAHLGLTQLPEVIALTQAVLADGRPEGAQEAEFLWGTALSIAGEDLDGAEQHLQKAAALTASGGTGPSLTRQAHVLFEMGNLAAQRGDLDTAIQQYQRALATSRQCPNLGAIQWEILSLNNLAYHSHLRGDAGAEGYAYSGIQVAQQHGILGMQAYLYSTLGEIMLAQGDLKKAGTHLAQGLKLAERFGIAERVAGIHASLGRLALAQGHREEARQALQQSLEEADAVGARRLSIQVRLWLAPLLPRDTARRCLDEARAIAQAGQRIFLDEIETVARQIE